MRSPSPRCRRIARSTAARQITYFNNSPDTLRDLGMKLFMNIHRPGAPREGGASDAYLTSGVHVDSFAVSGKAQPWKNDPGFFTTGHVAIPAPLMPHDSVRLSLAWHYDMSREAGREGMLDSTTFYLAYFYPRVSVYDDYNGWDDMTFTDDQEFYSDFNDYDVTVRAPANFVVYGTGTLRNPAEVLQPEVAQRLQASLTSDRRHPRRDAGRLRGEARHGGERDQQLALHREQHPGRDLRDQRSLRLGRVERRRRRRDALARIACSPRTTTAPPTFTTW